MIKMMRVVMLALGLLTMTAAFARSDVRDGKAFVKPEKGGRYSINGYTMGKVELYGYLGQLRDDEHITGVVLKRGGDDDQRKVITSSCKTLQIEAFEEDGGDLKVLPLDG